MDTPKSSTHARSLDISGPEGYCLIDLTLIVLGHAISESAFCKICSEGILSIIELKKEGMAKKLAFHCNNKYCGSSTQFYTSAKRKDESSTPGPKVFKVNYHFVLGMRLISRGLTAMNLICGMLNMPQAMQQKTYESILRRIEIASDTVAHKSMKKCSK